MPFPRRFLSFPNLILILILISNVSFSAEKSEVTNSVDSPKTNVPVSSAPTDYKLRPLDLVDIRVFQEEDLTMTNNVVNDSTTYDSSSAPVNNLFTGNIGLEYRIQPYWTVYGTYSYQRNVSTIPANTYYDNRFSLGTAFKF